MVSREDVGEMEAKNGRGLEALRYLNRDQNSRFRLWDLIMYA